MDVGQYRPPVGRKQAMGSPPSRTRSASMRGKSAVRYLAIVIGPVVGLAVAVPSAADVVAVKLTGPQAGPARSERATVARAIPATAGFAYVNPDGLLLAGAL